MHAQTIVKAKDNENIHGSLFSRTRATMFFGTPHRGMLVDDILAMIGQSSQRIPLVRSLETGSPVLKRELESFINYSAIIKSKIITFKEGEQTRRLMKECQAPTCRLRPVANYPLESCRWKVVEEWRILHCGRNGIVGSSAAQLDGGIPSRRRRSLDHG